MPAEPPRHDASADAMRSHSTSCQLPVQLSEFASEAARTKSDAGPSLRVEFGRTRYERPLVEGTVVVFDQSNGQQVEVYHDDRLVARGTLVAADGRVGVRLVQVVHQCADREAA